MGWDEIGWDGMGWDGMGWNGMELNEMGMKTGTGWSGVGRYAQCLAGLIPSIHCHGRIAKLSPSVSISPSYLF